MATCPPLPAAEGSGAVSPACGVGGNPLASASARRSQVETLQPQVDLPALLAGKGHGADHEEGPVALQAVDEAHDLRVFAADAGFHRDFSQVGAGLALRVLDAREPHARRPLPDRRCARRWRSSWAGCACHRRPASGAGFFHALVQAAQRGGLKFQRLELNLLAGQGIGGAAVGGGPVQPRRTEKPITSRSRTANPA